MSFGWFVGDLSAICAASALGDFTLIEEGKVGNPGANGRSPLPVISQFWTMRGGERANMRHAASCPQVIPIVCVTRVCLLPSPHGSKLTVGSVSKLICPRMVGLENWPQSSRFVATNLDEISRVGIKNVGNESENRNLVEKLAWLELDEIFSGWNRNQYWRGFQPSLFYRNY